MHPPQPHPPRRHKRPHLWQGHLHKIPHHNQHPGRPVRALRLAAGQPHDRQAALPRPHKLHLRCLLHNLPGAPRHLLLHISLLRKRPHHRLHPPRALRLPRSAPRLALCFPPGLLVLCQRGCRVGLPLASQCPRLLPHS
eukprot:04341_3